MKKIVQTINLRRYKTKVIEEYLSRFPNENEFYVLYRDKTFEEVYFKDDLIRILEKDHIKPVQYIFDATERIIPVRDIYIDISEIEKIDRVEEKE